MWQLFLSLLGLGAPRPYFNQLNMYRAFPRLRVGNYKITSNPDPRYNCIAWAMGDTNRWWSPGLYWPVKVPKGGGRKVEDLIDAYQTEGFKVCDNGKYSSGVEKVALYGLNGDWTHAAKQLDAKWWSSKLGKSYDIQHRGPDDLGGGSYGQVVGFMAR